MKYAFGFLIASILLLSACTAPKYILCPDNITQVTNLSSCPKPAPSCPVSCDSHNNCTIDSCSALTNYTCVHTPVVPCLGNGICEKGEPLGSADCPFNCSSNNTCMADSYDYDNHICVHEKIMPCCGNEICESGETYLNCPADCNRTMETKIMNYQTSQHMEQAYTKDLSGTGYLYLTVTFIVHNIGINSDETLNYKTSKGFYFDPFKLKLEDENGKFYSVEYDSDSLPNYLDYAIIPMGNTVTAQLLFIVPLTVQHLRLAIYDKFGNRIDQAEIY